MSFIVHALKYLRNAKGKPLKFPFVSIRKWGYKYIPDSSWASTDCIFI